MNRPALRAAIEAEERGALEQAVSLYANILEAEPGCLEALNNLGAICYRHGQMEDAINFYAEALSFHPDFLPSRINLARCLHKLGRADEANQHYLEALARQADPLLESERLQMLVNCGELEQAAKEVATACSTSPQVAELWLVSGNASLYLCQPQAAETAYRHALALPGNSPAIAARARANLALALFAQSRFDEGFPLYEARLDPALRAHDAVSMTEQPWPRWQGEALAGKRILLIGEQGLGDQIQFARFCEALAAQGAQVELLASPVLRTLLASVPGLQASHSELPPNIQFDYWSPLLSVPLHMGCKNPLYSWSTPYLQADPVKRALWNRQLIAWSGGKRKIGLVWRGAAGNATDRLRSIPTHEILELVHKLTGQALFFSLHKDDAQSGELELICRKGIIPLGDMLNDFSDTAALISELDLVISVDTSVAHAAGALGCPLHVLLAAGIEWRWGPPGSPNCPLYPGARLHWKESRTRSWLALITLLGDELASEFAQNSSA